MRGGSRRSIRISIPSRACDRSRNRPSRLRRRREVANIFRRAFSRLRNGRGGPALVEIPVDLFAEEIPGPLVYEPVSFGALWAGYRRRAPGRSRAGRGETSGDLRGAGNSLCARLGSRFSGSRNCWPRRSPPASQGKSAFPEDHPLSLGSGGLAFPRAVPHFLEKADWILGAGCSFTETSFGIAMPAGKKFIHATLDPNHLNKDVRAEIGLIGDAQLTLEALCGRGRAIDPEAASFAGDR